MDRFQSAYPQQGGVPKGIPPLAALPGDPVHESLDAGELGLITRDLGRRAGADRTVLAIRIRASGPIEIASEWDARPDLEGLSSPALRDGFVDQVLDTQHSAVEPNAAGAPIRTPDGTSGALCAGFSAIRDPALTLWLVESYAQLAALCLHDPQALDGLLAAARRDALTGCLSYGAIRQELIREVRRAARHQRSVSCCFIDLDRFKAVNDRDGHLHGSRVLAGVAKALRDGMRDGDSLGRYGGDEFVALLPDTDEAAAFVLAERLRAKIASAEPSGTNSQVGASIGVAQWLPGSSPDEMLEAADDALRSAKALGGGVAIKASDLSTDTLPRNAPGRSE